MVAAIAKDRYVPENPVPVFACRRCNEPSTPHRPDEGASRTMPELVERPRSPTVLV